MRKALVENLRAVNQETLYYCIDIVVQKRLGFAFDWEQSIVVYCVESAGYVSHLVRAMSWR